MKKIIALCLSLILTMSLLSTTASAETGNAERNSAMIDYFAGKESDTKFTDDDVKAFGVYMSNFYTPFQTDLSNISDTMKTAVKELQGNNSSTLNNEQVENLINVVITNINKKSVKLQIGDSSGVTGEGDITFNKLLDADNKYNDLYFYPEGGSSAVFSLSPRTKSISGSTQYCNAVLMLAMYVCGTSMEDADLKTFITTHGEDCWRISPFGDIVVGNDKNFFVLLPGCMNPYTWKDSGEYFPAINLQTLPFATSLADKADASDKPWFDTLAKSKYETVLLTSLSVTCPTYNNRTEYLSSPINENVVLAVDPNAWLKAIGINTLNSSEDVEWVKGLHGVLSDYIFDVSDGGKVQDSLYIFDLQKEYYADSTEYNLLFDTNNKKEVKLAYEDGLTVGDLADKFKYTVKNKGWFALNDTVFGTLDYVGEMGVKGDEAEYFGNFCFYKLPEFLVTIANGVVFYPQIFYTYMKSGFSTVMPAVDRSLTSTLGDILSKQKNTNSDEVQKELLQRMMDLTAPEMNDTKSNLISSYFNGFILKAHRSMLGIKTNNIATVSNSGTPYSGFTGHVTTPMLRDVQFTSNLIDNYSNIYIALMAIVLACLAIMLLTHAKTWKQSLVLFLVMLICLALPQGAVDASISMSNSVSNAMYANRFNYWAMIQHQQELQNLREAENSGSDMTALLEKNLSMVTNYYASDSVQLKWMSAKKGDAFESIFGDSLKDENSATGLIAGAATFKFLFSGYFKQESYSTDAMATYVYRTYSSIAEAAKDGYSLLTDPGDIKTSLADDADLLEKVPELIAISNGVYETPVSADYKPNLSNTHFRSGMYGNSAIEKAITCKDGVEWGNSVGFDIPAQDLSSDMNTYLLYSESPFYYFYNTLMSTEVNGVTPALDDSDNVTNFLSNFLSDDMYKVTVADSPMYGMTKDFLDMEGLFTYVVPYLYASNKVVIDFTELRGTDYNKYLDNVNSMRDSVNSASDSEILQDQQNLAAKAMSLNSKEDIERMWNMYSPWVDALYSASYVNDNIKVMNRRTLISDALNPAFYYNEEQTKGRPMAFGEADMYVKGITVGDATVVENKINNVLKETYTDFRYLANYSMFSDDVLITAAAMAATFNFNKEFSEANFFKEGVTLYPQGYELKTFSYDAFLRLILLNSTGQSVMAKTDIYTAVIENCSFWTGIFLVIVDALAIYVLPTAKLIFIILVFVLSLLMLMSCFLQGIEHAPKTVLQALILPLIKFLGITTAHAFATSLLMGEGLTDLVGSQTGAIITNDPTVTLILLAVINALVSVLLISTIIKLIKTGIEWVKATITAMTGLIASLANIMTAGVRNLVSTGKLSIATPGGIDGFAGLNNGFKRDMSNVANSFSRSAKKAVSSIKKESADLPRTYSKKENEVLKDINSTVKDISSAVGAGALKAGGAHASRSNKLKNALSDAGEKLKATRVAQNMNKLKDTVKSSDTVQGIKMTASDVAKTIGETKAVQGVKKSAATIKHGVTTVRNAPKTLYNKINDGLDSVNNSLGNKLNSNNVFSNRTKAERANAKIKPLLSEQTMRSQSLVATQQEKQLLSNSVEKLRDESDSYMLKQKGVGMQIKTKLNDINNLKADYTKAITPVNQEISKLQAVASLNVLNEAQKRVKIIQSKQTAAAYNSEELKMQTHAVEKEISQAKSLLAQKTQLQSSIKQKYESGLKAAELEVAQYKQQHADLTAKAKMRSNSLAAEMLKYNQVKSREAQAIKKLSETTASLAEETKTIKNATRDKGVFKTHIGE